MHGLSENSFNITDFPTALPWHPVPDYDGTLQQVQDVWMAWEFVRPVQGDGMIQAFRRENSPTADIHLKLRGLSDGAQYEFTDLDTGGKVKASGKELMTDGLALKAPTPRTALVLAFKELK